MLIYAPGMSMNWIQTYAFLSNIIKSGNRTHGPALTHWGRVTHICVCKLTTIGSDNGLSPGRRQAIIWSNAGILLDWTLGTNFSDILSEIDAFSFKQMRLKMSSGKWRPYCLGLNVLIKKWLCYSGHRVALVVHRAQKSVPDSAGEWPTFLPPPLESCSGTANADGPNCGRFKTHNGHVTSQVTVMKNDDKMSHDDRQTSLNGSISALLTLCTGNLPVTGEFPAQRPVTRSFGVFFDLRLNKQLSKQWWGWWFETPSRPLWRHRNATCLSHVSKTPCGTASLVLMDGYWYNKVIHSGGRWW